MHGQPVHHIMRYWRYRALLGHADAVSMMHDIEDLMTPRATIKLVLGRSSRVIPMERCHTFDAPPTNDNQE